MRIDIHIMLQQQDDTYLLITEYYVCARKGQSTEAHQHLIRYNVANRLSVSETRSCHLEYLSLLSCSGVAIDVTQL